MRLTVITDKKMLSLGIFAKDIFADIVLKVDSDKSFDVVQIVENDTLEKVKKLPIDYGITQDIKDGIISAFEEMSLGTKFLCVSDWIIDFKSPKAKAYWQIQKDVNDGMDYLDAVNKANEFLKENE
ncbi:hypothetical protein [Aliarcobacter butzleri]|uniref:hypothetical protein n=1 Tax=Aliarcobacter butzleri TaxID=28197 RepID=UPI0021B2DABD|nr:hypothetical protein [Aliarcobacter butzleri]MCT7564138.1 hypothetical protein [Aliarcobacter butzleri]MCT7578703.1 hypothetical protein [Aliarcobacter butzleri]